MDWKQFIIILLVISSGTYLLKKCLEVNKDIKTSEGHPAKKAIFYLFCGFTILTGFISLITEVIFSLLNEWFGVEKIENFEWMAFISYCVFAICTAIIIRAFYGKNTSKNEAKKVVKNRASDNASISTNEQKTKTGNIINNYYGTDKKKVDKTTQSQLAWLSAQPQFMATEIVGRDDKIVELKSNLDRDAQQAIISVSGLGGIGKTTLAKAYVEKYEKHYAHIIWISKTGQNILHDFADDKFLVNSLGLKKAFSKPNLSYEERLIDIKQALEQKMGSKKLLVLDNVDKELETSQALQLLPQQNGWQLLVTSRNQSNRIKQQLKLDVLSPENAAKLFCLHYPNAENDTDLKALLQYIGWHTLSTELLAKLMAKKAPFGGINCGELLAKLQAHALDDDEIRKKLAAENYTEAEQSLFAHLMACFDTDNLDKWELWWLKHFAVLPAQAYNYEDLYYLLGVKKQDDENAIEEALDSLVKTGWIKAYEKEGIHYYECHRLLQEVLLHKEELKWEDYNDLETYIWNLRNLIYVDESKEHWIDKKPFLPFCDRLYELIPECKTKAFSHFLNVYAQFVKEAFGNYKKSAEVYEKNLIIFLKLEEEEGVNVAACRSNLANVYSNLGRHEEAVELLESALKSDIHNFGEEHPDVANSQSNLANVYGDLGRHKEAADLLEKVLIIVKKEFETHDPRISICQSNLAVVYGNLGRHKEAVELLEKALKSDVENFGLINPKTATRLNNLGIPYFQLKRLGHAYSCLFMAVAIRLKRLGEHHPHTQSSVEGLALFRENLPDVTVDIPFLIELLGVSQSDIEALIDETEGFLEGGVI